MVYDSERVVPRWRPVNIQSAHVDDDLEDLHHRSAQACLRVGPGGGQRYWLGAGPAWEGFGASAVPEKRPRGGDTLARDHSSPPLRVTRPQAPPRCGCRSVLWAALIFGSGLQLDDRRRIRPSRPNGGPHVPQRHPKPSGTQGPPKALRDSG